MAAREYDVLIVGSGHSGGMAAKVLTEAGYNCLMLNAGPEFDRSKYTETRSTYDLPYHGFGQPGKLKHVYQANENNANQWVDEQEIPYTYDPGQQYNWVRVRLIGGRSLFWSRQSFRLSDYEFDCADIDGRGTSWPIRLADVAPYYSKVEGIFRVTGRNEGWKQFPDANLVENAFGRGGRGGGGGGGQVHQKMTDALAKRGIGVSVMRSSMGQGGGPAPASSINLLLPDAFATGRLELVPNAIVRQISVDKKTGKADGAHFVDRHSRREMHVKAKVVVLAAGTLESTRLMLLSNLGGSSGQLGHWLHDQIYGVRVVASVPEAQDGKAPQGLMGGSLFLPRFRNLKKDEKRNFIKGYCMMMNAGGSPNANDFAEYGAALQKKLDHYAGSCLTASIYGERPPRFENHVRLSKDVVDAWGIPVLHISVKDGENELNQAQDAANFAAEIFNEAGATEVITKSAAFYPPGYSIHEVGTARMGDDPKTSVLNKWNQVHDMPNLVVVDGSCFVSCGWQNPTMTILSLAMRASEHLAEEMKKGNV